MADRARIADLWGGYGAGNDLRDFDLLESCFTEDVSFTVHIAGGDTVGPLRRKRFSHNGTTRPETKGVDASFMQ
jgi:hypothetical protein